MTRGKKVQWLKFYLGSNYTGLQDRFVIGAMMESRRVPMLTQASVQIVQETPSCEHNMRGLLLG